MKNTICQKCHCKGYFGAKSFLRTVSTMTTEEMAEEAYLDYVTSDSPSAWKVAVQVGTYPTIFKLDTGPEITVVTT